VEIKGIAVAGDENSSEPPTVEILGLTPPVEKRSFEPLQWKLRLTTTNESTKQIITKTEKHNDKRTGSEDEENLR
jgi:hypothetical protein